MAPGAQQFPLVAIVGPTGSGKSDLALQIAAEFRGEIVNCDSLQLYRYLDIGTAKVPLAERQSIPHHLLDVLDPDQVYTAGEYARAARPIVREIADRGRLPVVAGGTGFYLRALLDGLFSGPGRNDALRRRLAGRERRHPGWLHRTLTRFDPPSANRIQPADVQKLIRAVEVLLLTRRPLSAWAIHSRSRSVRIPSSRATSSTVASPEAARRTAAALNSAVKCFRWAPMGTSSAPSMGALRCPRNRGNFNPSLRSG